MERPWSDGAFKGRGEVAEYSDDSVKTVYIRDRVALSILNLKRNQAIYWTKDYRDVPYFETGAPLLGILPQWFQNKGACFLHGAAVGVDEAGVLIAGQGGSGKSTTALKCLEHSLHYLADDYCLVEPSQHSEIFSVYSSGKIDPDQLTFFEPLRGSLVNAARVDTEKALFMFNAIHGNRIKESLPLKAILIPQITNLDTTSFRRARPIDAFKALAPSTLFQIAKYGQTSAKMIAAIVNSNPCYDLLLGRNLDEIPESIRNFIRTQL